MKRIFAFLLSFLLLTSCAQAAIPDFSTITNAEIMDIINAGRNALYISKPIQGELARCEANGVTIIITNVRQAGGDTRYALIDWTVVNNSNIEYYVTVKAIYVNGWKVYDSVFFPIEAHRKSKETINFFITDADITSIQAIEDIEIQMYLRPASGGEITTLDPMYIKKGN